MHSRGAPLPPFLPDAYVEVRLPGAGVPLLHHDQQQPSQPHAPGLRIRVNLLLLVPLITLAPLVVRDRHPRAQPQDGLPRCNN